MTHDDFDDDDEPAEWWIWCQGKPDTIHPMPRSGYLKNPDGTTCKFDSVESAEKMARQVMAEQGITCKVKRYK